MARTLTITRRNATFQQWQAMLTNRSKRQRAGAFLVQGVRPIDQAIGNDWPIHWVLFDRDRHLSSWAEGVIGRCDQLAAMGSDLIAELGEKNEEPPEILVIGGMPEDRLTRISASDDMLVLALDRPSSPGNVGSIVRSADALGASGVVISGHAADPYDPKAIRASTGSIFSVPVVRVGGPRDVADWTDHLAATYERPKLIGMDEVGDTDLWGVSLTGAAVIAIGNEATGLSNSWRETCDTLVRIPIGGSASSLNAANAATVALYEAVRQRTHVP